MRHLRKIPGDPDPDRLEWWQVAWLLVFALALLALILATQGPH